MLLTRGLSRLRLSEFVQISEFLASQDAIEVMRVTHSLTEWVSVSIDLTDVTLLMKKVRKVKIVKEVKTANEVKIVKKVKIDKEVKIVKEVKIAKEVKVVKEVERSDSLWRFAYGNVLIFT